MSQYTLLMCRRHLGNRAVQCVYVCSRTINVHLFESCLFLASGVCGSAGPRSPRSERRLLEFICGL